MLSASFSLNVLGQSLHLNLCSLFTCFSRTGRSLHFKWQWLHISWSWLTDSLLCKRLMWTLRLESISKVELQWLHFTYFEPDSEAFSCTWVILSHTSSITFVFSLLTNLVLFVILPISSASFFWLFQPHIWLLQTCSAISCCNFASFLASLALSNALFCNLFSWDVPMFFFFRISLYFSFFWISLGLVGETTSNACDRLTDTCPLSQHNSNFTLDFCSQRIKNLLRYGDSWSFTDILILSEILFSI